MLLDTPFRSEGHPSIVMINQRVIVVGYTNAGWTAEFDSYQFYAARLMCLIAAMQRACAGERLVFVVDKLAIEGCENAEPQFLEASEKSGAFVVWSTEFD
jgi:hypothetical protein